MIRLKVLLMTVSLSVPLFFGVVQPASSEEWEGLTWSNMCDATNYVCSIPEKAGKILDELDKKLLDSADEVEEAASEIAEVVSPLATAAAQSDLTKIIRTTSGEVTKKIAQQTLAVADKLTTAVKVAGSLSTDKPDYVGATEAVYHGYVGGAFAAAGGAIGTVATGLLLSSNPVGWATAAGWGIGAVGGAVVYMNTVQPEAAKAFEAAATAVRENEVKNNMEEAEKQSSKIKQAQLDKLNCPSNSVADWNNGHPICICPDKNTRWLKALNKCATKYEALDNCKKYPGSIIAVNAPKGCKCPTGTKWSKKQGRCAKKTTNAPVVSGGQCPMKNPYARSSHKHDTNGNLNDKTYMYCQYTNEEILFNQTPYINGKIHGIATRWAKNHKTGGYFVFFETEYSQGVMQKTTYYKSDGTVNYVRRPNK